jgi:hypothetical protein
VLDRQFADQPRHVAAARDDTCHVDTAGNPDDGAHDQRPVRQLDR